MTTETLEKEQTFQLVQKISELQAAFDSKPESSEQFNEAVVIQELNVLIEKVNGYFGRVVISPAV